MKAKSIYEFNFERGLNPYQSLDIGIYRKEELDKINVSDIETYFEALLSQTEEDRKKIYYENNEYGSSTDYLNNIIKKIHKLIGDQIWTNWKEFNKKDDEEIILMFREIKKTLKRKKFKGYKYVYNFNYSYDSIQPFYSKVKLSKLENLLI